MDLIKKIAPVAGAISLAALTLTGCGILFRADSKINYGIKKPEYPLFFHEGKIDGVIADLNKDGIIDLLTTWEEDGIITLDYIESNPDGTYTTHIYKTDKKGHVTVRDFTPLREEGSVEIGEITTNK